MLFGMVESSNYPSLKAFRKAGYAHSGTVHAAAIGRRIFLHHSSACIKSRVFMAVHPNQHGAGHEQKSVRHAA